MSSNRSLRPDLAFETRWPLVPLRHLLSANDGGAWGDDPHSEEDPIVLRSTEQAIDGSWRIEEPARRRLTQKEFEKTRLLAGDILVTKSSGSADHIGKASLVDEEIEGLNASYSNFMQRLRTTEDLSPEFLTLLLNNPLVRKQMAFLSNSTTGLANVSASIIGNVVIPLPDTDEQKKIIQFLGSETGQIDGLIEKKTRFIALLKEKRAAVIDHAVTKGMDPRAEMKFSGVEWIGDIPAHWDVPRIATLLREAFRKPDPDLPVLSVSIHNGVSDGELSDEERDRKVALSEDRTKYQGVEPGDLVYNMMRAWQGAFGAVAVSGLVSPAYVVARPIAEFRTKFLEHLLHTKSAAEEIRRYSRGIADFRMRLYWEYFRDIRVCLPPLSEQDEILSHIDRETARIEGLIEKTERSIALLKEKRAALITAAVTGKIDVRAAA
ncbi:restriction endonuclease subunit S [Phaeobacter inhibens]|uniref:restriction endonuclease subunit S n=1 Tax=Phaeobacter inhibens TaxID=221822 RepID=UPI0021A792B3|nr:restriction endonuclease subunit S [Phaeobacter inhibens]UWR98956.1 restriction endonuclease subunit S [Phaeobacter inhibens]